MRSRATVVAAASSALVLSVLAAGAPAVAEPSAPTDRAPEPYVYVPRDGIPAWGIANRAYPAQVVLVRNSLTPSEADGARVRIQLRDDDSGAWTVIGRGTTTLDPNRDAARAEVRIRLGDPGTVRLRAQVRVGGDWLGAGRTVEVTATGPRFAVRRTTGTAFSDWVSIGNRGRHSAWGDGAGFEYPSAYAAPTFGTFTQTRNYLGGKGDVAASAPITANSSYQVVGGEDLGPLRVKLHDFASGTTVDVARQLDGSQLTRATQPSLSSDGRTAAFVTARDRVVRGTPKDNRYRVYLARPFAGTVRVVGVGLEPDVSPSGRYVTWVDPADRVRLFDARQGTTRTVYAREGHRPAFPEIVSDGGAIVLTRKIGTAPREGIRLDVGTREVTVLGDADETSASDDGRRVALLRGGDGDGGDVFIWRRAVPRPVLVTEGPDGQASGTAYSADLDPRGRYLAVGLTSGRVPMVPGGGASAVTVRYDLGG